MRTLVIAETDAGKLKKASREAVGAAHSLGGEVDAALLGKDLSSAAAVLGSLGVKRVYLAESDHLQVYGSVPYTSTITGRIVSQAQPDVILFSATSTGKDLAPRVAHRLGCGLLTDVTELTWKDGALEGVRPMYSGKLSETVRAEGKPQIASLRPNAFAPPAETGARAEVLTLEADPGDFATVVREVSKAAANKVPLNEAEVIVSGGRGLGGPEHFHLVEELAAVLGAAVGASRAVVDAGWRPHAEQVGQTGKTVTPKLYFAIAISGAIQHLAGMGRSRFIVAVNKDPDAPIFKVADYGIVGDAFQVVPKLIEEFRKLKAA